MRSRALSLAALAILVALLDMFAASIAAHAQNLDAGKSPAQIFSGTCSACHRSARGLVKNVAPGSLSGFLRQHYTTSNEMASSMAAYVMASGGTDRVAEPKREPRQKATQQTETPDAAAARQQLRQERRERAKADREKAAKKGRAEPAEASKPVEDKAKPVEEPARPVEEAVKPAPASPVETVPEAPASSAGETPAVAPATPAPVEAAPPAAPDSRPSPPAAAPARPAGIVLPGFPLPEAAPEPVPQAPAPVVAPPPTAPESPAVSPAPSPPEQSSLPAANNAAPPQPPQSPASDGPKTDIMQEEVHTPKPAPAGQRKKRNAE